MQKVLRGTCRDINTSISVRFLLALHQHFVGIFKSTILAINPTKGQDKGSGPSNRNLGPIQRILILKHSFIAVTSVQSESQKSK